MSNSESPSKGLMHSMNALLDTLLDREATLLADTIADVAVEELDSLLPEMVEKKSPGPVMLSGSSCLLDIIMATAKLEILRRILAHKTLPTNSVPTIRANVQDVIKRVTFRLDGDAIQLVLPPELGRFVVTAD